MRILIVCALGLACASCGLYQSSWDCPPGQGIGCKPVSEVVNLIVEKEQGEDLFVHDSGSALLLKEQEKKKQKKKRVVVAPKEEENKKLFLLKETSGDNVLIEAKEAL